MKTMPTREIAALAASAWIAALASQRPAAALPQYAEKEGKPCAYCHVAPQGAGPRNYRGLYYALHGRSFTFFDDGAEAAKAGVPVGPDAQPQPRSYLPSTPSGAQIPPEVTPAQSAGPAHPAPPAAQPGGTSSPVKKAADAVEAARTFYGKHPTLEARRAYAQALAALGKAIWEAAPAPAPKRYSEARSLYLRALDLDPTSAFAADEERKLVAAGLALGLGTPVPPPPGTVFVQDGAYLLALLAKPDPLRPNTLEIRVTRTGSNDPVPGVKFASEQRMPGMADMGVSRPAAEEAGNGTYRLPLAFTMLGVWQVRLTGETTDGARIETILDFDAGGITWKPGTAAGFRISGAAPNTPSVLP